MLVSRFLTAETLKHSPETLPFISAQPAAKRCFTPVGKEMLSRAQAVVDEVEGLVVKYSIVRDYILLRHARGRTSNRVFAYE